MQRIPYTVAVRPHTAAMLDAIRSLGWWALVLAPFLAGVGVIAGPAVPLAFLAGVILARAFPFATPPRVEWAASVPPVEGVEGVEPIQ